MRILEVKNWKKVAIDRDKWAKLLKKARAHQGLSSQWWWWWWWWWHGGAIGRMRVWFPMSLTSLTEIFHWSNPSGHTISLGSPQPLTEMSTRNVSWGVRRPVRMADNLTTFMCRLSWNLGASTSWNPLGLCRPVMGLLYLYLYTQKGNSFEIGILPVM